MTNANSVPTKAVGRVASRTAGSLVVEIEAEVCPRCAAGQGCGAGLFTGGAQTVTMSVPLEEWVDALPGDRVYITLAPGSLLRAVLCLYGLPLTGLLTGSAVALSAGVTDALAAAGSVAGLVAGLLLGRHVARRDTCLSTLQPTFGGRANESSGIAAAKRV